MPFSVCTRAVINTRSRFDKLETRAGESGCRLARAEAAERLVRVAKLGCPELGLASFEVNYREALEALLLTLAPAPPVLCDPARDYSSPYGGVSSSKAQKLNRR
jgi:hypothetical protein